MINYLKGRRIDVETDTAVWEKYTYLKKDENGIWIKKKRQGLFIPWRKVKIIYFSYESNQNQEIEQLITIGKKQIKLNSNEDIFEDRGIDDKTKSLIQLKLMYIDNYLYLSNSEAYKKLKSIKFPVKVNGRMINNLKELFINEKMFLGIV